MPQRRGVIASPPREFAGLEQSVESRIQARGTVIVSGGVMPADLLFGNLAAGKGRLGGKHHGVGILRLDLGQQIVGLRPVAFEQRLLRRLQPLARHVVFELRQPQPQFPQLVDGLRVCGIKVAFLGRNRIQLGPQNGVLADTLVQLGANLRLACVQHRQERFLGQPDNDIGIVASHDHRPAAGLNRAVVAGLYGLGGGRISRFLALEPEPPRDTDRNDQPGRKNDLQQLHDGHCALAVILVAPPVEPEHGTSPLG